MEKALKAIEKVLDDAIEKLSMDKEYFQDQYKLVGFTTMEINFLKKIQDGTLN